MRKSYCLQEWKIVNTAVSVADQVMVREAEAVAEGTVHVVKADMVHAGKVAEDSVHVLVHVVGKAKEMVKEEIDLVLVLVVDEAIEMVKEEIDLVLVHAVDRAIEMVKEIAMGHEVVHAADSVVMAKTPDLSGRDPSAANAEIRILLFFYCFGIDSDKDIIANDNSALIHCAIPAYAKIMTVNLCFCNKTSTGFWSFVNPIFPEGSIPLS